MEQLFPPSPELVAREIADHLAKNKDLAPLFKVYQEILAVQRVYLDKIAGDGADAGVGKGAGKGAGKDANKGNGNGIGNGIGHKLSAEEIKDCFRQKKYLFAVQKPEIDTELFREILAAICKAIFEASPGAPAALLNLPAVDDFKENNLKEFLEAIALFNKQELDDFIQKREVDKKIGVDSEVITFAIFMSLSPFYSAYMKGVNQKVGFTIWRQGFCPICGQTSVMARHASENGARVLECWLCHAAWDYPRLECPYCHNKEQKKLRFFYVVGDKARQVHVCEECKVYLKTIDGKVMEKDVLLDVEAIATGYLDILARKEGYRLPGEVAVLN